MTNMRRPRIFSSAFASASGLLAATCLVPAAAQATNLLSGSVTVTGDYPTPTTLIPGYGPFTGPTSGGITACCGYSFAFTANTISYYNPYAGYYNGNGTNFDGWVLTFSGVPTITDVTNDPASQMTPVSITFTSNTVELNFSGELRPGPTTSIFDVTFATSVPEPATWAIMLTGLGLAGGELRRRRAASAAAWPIRAKVL